MTAISGAEGILPFGIIRVIAGLAFSLGLILVMIAGGELFTGNALMIIAVLNKKISIQAWLKNLGIIYISNFVGALIIVALLYGAQRQLFGGASIQTSLTTLATHKLTY